jgi:hypothetical protein
MTIEIRQHAPGSKLKDFLSVVDTIYRDDRAFVRPLDMDMGDRLSLKNPFFEHGEAMLFTAYQNGQCVGRISASIDRLHLDKYKDGAGFFGFFDTIEDQAVANQLLEAAATWLRQRGSTTMRGPLSLSINEELGCLIQGFETPPMPYMPHHRPYQSKLIEGAGLVKQKDFYAWRYVPDQLAKRVEKAHAEIAAMPNVTARPIDLKNLKRDIGIVMAIHEDAWAENWGAVGFTAAELKKMAADFRLIMQPELTVLVEIDGRPAAFALALPNVNEMIGDLHGKLFPFGLIKLIYRLKVRGARSARLALLGVEKEFRTQRKYAGLSAFLYAQMHIAGKKLGIEWGELSWTVEDNGAVNAGIRRMGAQIYKRYRVYERALTA